MSDSRPPDTETTTWVWNEELRDWVEVEKAKVEPVDTPRPADDNEGPWERSVQDVDGVPTVVWTRRAWTPEELAQRAAQVEREALRTLLKAIITDLQVEKARAQTILDKTNAQLVLTDVKDLARAVKRIADAAIELARFVA